MTLVDTSTLVRHARELAAAFEILLIEVVGLPPEDAAANTTERAVVAAPIIDETTYAVVLHEIGHILAPLGSLAHQRQRATSIEQAHRLRLEAEDAAWAWAKHYALDWTPAMDALRVWAYGTYEAAAAAARIADAPTVAPARPTHRVGGLNDFAKKIRWTR